MPLFYQHTINEATRIGIWEIKENEAFFLQKVPLQREVSHPHKRLQHLAGRYLLQYLFPGFPYELIAIAGTRKPYLTNETYHFSIAHCGNFAAALVSTSNRVGIDIELARPLIEKVKNKFISEHEMQLITREAASVLITSPGQGQAPPLLTLNLEPLTPNSPLPTPDFRLLTLIWSAKEALFKWFGEGAVDFRQHMQVESIHRNGDKGHLQCTFRKSGMIKISVPFQTFDSLVLAWVVS